MEDLDFTPIPDPGNDIFGYSSSRGNASTHGCRSRIVVILPGERQEDYDQLYQRWMDAYEPEDDATAELVEQLIINKWLLQRNLRRYMSIEEKLSRTDYADWTAEQHKEFQLAHRYKTAAERTVGRSQRDLASTPSSPISICPRAAPRQSFKDNSIPRSCAKFRFSINGSKSR